MFSLFSCFMYSHRAGQAGYSTESTTHPLFKDLNESQKEHDNFLEAICVWTNPLLEQGVRLFADYFSVLILFR